ncbi:MAG TPA: PepSY domain-containing protein [Steroidobacteraceae bacterium]|jgi:hypothetical protein
MHHLIALFAGCLLHPPADDPCKEARTAQAEFLRSHGAEVTEWNANGTVRTMKTTGIVLPPRVADLKVDESAPAILSAIGPALLARGTEELRVRDIFRDELGDSIQIKLDQFIGGHEVLWAKVGIIVNAQSYEITALTATFMPDRGLEHEPRLSPDEARAKATPALRQSVRTQPGSADKEVSFSDEPAQLVYEFEELSSQAILGGALVWLFSAKGVNKVSVDAATGRIVRISTVFVSWPELPRRP